MKNLGPAFVILLAILAFCYFQFKKMELRLISDQNELLRASLMTTPSFALENSSITPGSLQSMGFKYSGKI